MSGFLFPEKTLQFICDCDLSDGVHPTVVGDHGTILKSVEEWLTNATNGEMIKIQAKEMSQEELAKLKEI